MQASSNTNKRYEMDVFACSTLDPVLCLTACLHEAVFAGYDAGRIEGNLFSSERGQTADRPDSRVNETEADTETD